MQFVGAIIETDAACRLMPFVGAIAETDAACRLMPFFGATIETDAACRLMTFFVQLSKQTHRPYESSLVFKRRLALQFTLFESLRLLVCSLVSSSQVKATSLQSTRIYSAPVFTSSV